jgi:hypothetical protein
MKWIRLQWIKMMDSLAIPGDRQVLVAGKANKKVLLLLTGDIIRKLETNRIIIVFMNVANSRQFTANDERAVIG